MNMVIKTMKSLAIELNNLSKSYGAHHVLSEIDLAVNTGEYIGLVGVNGSGKTTMMKCMLDFCAITSGSIRLFGIEHTDIAAREQLVFLPEKFLPPYYLTGMNFLDYMASLNGTVINTGRIEELLNVLDLDQSSLSRPVRQYSKGMAQKLGLIACLESDKGLFLFDEPMSGLDPKARAYLKQHLLDLKQQGKTLFFSTHLLADVEALCDRLAILHKGKLQFVGTPEECCHQYQCNNLEQAYIACVSGNEK